MKVKVNLVQITQNPIEMIYRAYRICYSKVPFEEVKIPSTKDGAVDNQKMIDFIKPLMAEQHTSPLEHVSCTFSIQGLSRAALAQITRHRTGKFNVQSQRYVDGSNFSFIMPNLDYVEDEDKKILAATMLMNSYEESKEMYQELVELGVKKEDARSVLPQSTTCNLVVTFDVNNFRNFLRQRMCKAAQQEIREVALEMNRLVKEYVPFVDYKVLLCQQGLCDRCSK